MKTLHNPSIRRNPSPSPAHRPGDAGRAWRQEAQPTPALRQAALRFKLRRLEMAVELDSLAGKGAGTTAARGVEQADVGPHVEGRYEDAERWDGLS